MNISKDPFVNSPYSPREWEGYHSWIYHSITTIRIGLLILSIFSLINLGFVLQAWSSWLSVLAGLLITSVPMIGLFLSIWQAGLFIRYYFLLSRGVIVISCIGIPAISLWQQHALVSEILFPIMLILIIWIYSFTRIGLLEIIRWGCCTSIIYFYFSLNLPAIHKDASAIYLLLILLVNSIGIALGYEHEKQARLLPYLHIHR